MRRFQDVPASSVSRAPGAPRVKDSKMSWAAGEPILSSAMIARIVRTVSGSGALTTLFKTCSKRRRVSSVTFPFSDF
jgi:hypothetical protein